LLAVGGLALLTGASAAFLDGIVAHCPARVEVALGLERGTRPRPGIVLRRHPPEALGSRREAPVSTTSSSPVALRAARPRTGSRAFGMCASKNGVVAREIERKYY
jgi:hypothetical protein